MPSVPRICNFGVGNSTIMKSVTVNHWESVIYRDDGKMLNREYASLTSSWVTNRYLFAHQFLASYFLNFVFPFITEGWVLGLVLGLVLGWVLGGVLGLVFIFCIPFTQRHFRKIGVGLSKNYTSTPLKGDEDGAEDRRTGSSKVTNWQLHNHKVPLCDSKS